MTDNRNPRFLFVTAELPEIMPNPVTRSKIVGRIITLWARGYDGLYADCHDDYMLKCTQCDHTDVPNAEWTRFIVHEGPGDDTFLLESLRYCNYYVDPRDADYKVHLLHSFTPPINEPWAQ